MEKALQGEGMICNVTAHMYTSTALSPTVQEQSRHIPPGLGSQLYTSSKAPDPTP